MDQVCPQIGVSRVGGIESAVLFIDTFLSQSAVALGVTAPLLTTTSHKTDGSLHAGEILGAKKSSEPPPPIRTGGPYASFLGIPTPYKK